MTKPPVHDAHDLALVDMVEHARVRKDAPITPDAGDNVVALGA